MPSGHAQEPDGDQAPAFGRRETLLATLRRLYALHPRPACIVETGTLRCDNEGHFVGDGWATVAWAWYSDQTGGRAYTVDINPEALGVSRRLTAGYADAMEYVHSDSVQFLRAWRAAPGSTARFGRA